MHWHSEIEAACRRNSYTKTPAKERLWKENIARLEDFTLAAREETARKQGCPTRTTDRRRLYLGPQVANHGHTLLPKVSRCFRSSDPFQEAQQVDYVPEADVSDLETEKSVSEEEYKSIPTAVQVEVQNLDLETPADVSWEHAKSSEPTERETIR